MTSRADEYSNLFASFVVQQEDAKESLERRSNDLLRGIAAVITILVAVAAIAGGDAGDLLKGWEVWLVPTSLTAFLAAGVLALIVLVPRKYESAQYEQFYHLFTRSGFIEHWQDPDPRRADITRLRIAEANLVLAKRARDANQSKAKTLVGSMWCAFAGVASLAYALALAIT